MKIDLQNIFSRQEEGGTPRPTKWGLSFMAKDGILGEDVHRVLTARSVEVVYRKMKGDVQGSCCSESTQKWE